MALSKSIKKTLITKIQLFRNIIMRHCSRRLFIYMGGISGGRGIGWYFRGWE